MSELKCYKCHKCGIEIETNEPDFLFEIPTQSKKHYYLCPACYEDGEYNYEKDIKYETEETEEED